MRGYSTMSDEERNSILQQHSAFYNGYATGNIPSGPQPLLQDEGPSDSQGITVNNRGEVGQYRNHLVNESVVSEQEGKGCAKSEGGSGCIKKQGDEWVIMNNKKGGIFRDGFKSEKDAEEALDAYHASVSEEVKEYAADDMDVSDVEAAYDFESGGPDQFGDEDMTYSEDSYGMDIDSIMSMFDGSITADYDDEVPAYQFDSEGAMDVDLYEGADKDEDGELSPKELHKHFDGNGDGTVTTDEYKNHIDQHIMDILKPSLEAGLSLKDAAELERMKMAERGGINPKSEIMQTLKSIAMGELGEITEKETCEQCGSEMKEGECKECGTMYEEVDEDLRESFIEDRQRINEMFDRFKKFL